LTTPVPMKVTWTAGRDVLTQLRAFCSPTRVAEQRVYF
jgi:hypothetical protein